MNLSIVLYYCNMVVFITILARFKLKLWNCIIFTSELLSYVNITKIYMVECNDNKAFNNVFIDNI